MRDLVGLGLKNATLVMNLSVMGDLDSERRPVFHPKEELGAIFRSDSKLPCLELW